MSINTSPTTGIRTLRRGDPKFVISDGYVCAGRAAIEIRSDCPSTYRSIIMTCLNEGWLMPIANVKDNELFWETFEK